MSLADRWRWIAAAPFLASGFRPFYLLGALYAPPLVAGSAGVFSGIVDLDAPRVHLLWHGHKMMFGFATAIVVGTLLTALPSWVSTPEISGAPLAWLALARLLGRAAFWAAPWLP